MLPFSSLQVGFSTEETPTYIFPEIIGRPRAVWKVCGSIQFHCGEA